VIEAGVVLLALALRVIPIRLSGPGFGGDRWYWRAYIEEVRASGRIPPRLPQYLLDVAHWYPPAFPWLVARLPPALLDRYDRWLAVGLDLARLLLAMAAARQLGFGTGQLLVVGITYAISPILVSYNSQLNPRALGAILLDGCVLLCLTAIGGAGPVAWLGAALLLAGVLLTHKMTTQLAVAYALVAAVLTGPALLALLPVAVGLALVVSRGFYLKVLRAHVDIVTFWDRNWRWLFCHPVHDSPLYREAGREEAPDRLHRPGLRGVARSLAGIFGFLPSAWLAVAAAGGSRADEGLLAWTLTALCFALATTYVPRLRCLGAGYLYSYNAALPASLLWGSLWARPEAWLAPLWAVACLASCASLAVAIRRVAATRSAGADEDWDAVVKHVKNLPPGPILCLPYGRADALAYATGRPVVWGGHGYGFRELEPLFPRLLVPVAEVRRRYGVRYLLTEDRQPAAFEAAVGDAQAAAEFGRYKLLSLPLLAVAEPAARTEA